MNSHLSSFEFGFLSRVGLSHRNPSIAKAHASDFRGRFREVVADPLNQYIDRSPLAGSVEDDHVILHNGLRVPLAGDFSYYGNFSDILVINRGVHEPLEEYCFQEVLKTLPSKPVMLELGAYWAHYSMWLKKTQPDASCYMVEPEECNIKSGKYNFELNHMQGIFIQDFVSAEHFTVDTFLQEHQVPRLHILHSDIQGYEVDMLAGAENALEKSLVDWVFLSTHSQTLHYECVSRLQDYGYCILVSSCYDYQTTSYDGFILACSKRMVTT